VRPLAEIPDDIAPLVEVAAGKRSVQDDGGDAPARPGQGPGPARSPKERLPRGAADRVRVFDAFPGILLIVGRRQGPCDAVGVTRHNVGAIECLRSGLQLLERGLECERPP